MKTRFSFWPLFALIVAAIIFFSMLFFILDAPLPSSWDEGLYFNRAHYDQQAFQKNGFGGLVSVLFREDPHQPPAYRILALPWNLIFGVHPISLEAYALFFWCLTLWLIYLTGKLLAGVDAGAFAVVYLAICPIVIRTGKQFCTEDIFYFSIAALLWATVTIMTSDRERFMNWIALAASVFLGGMAKLSFFFILGPFVIILFFLGLRDKTAKPSPLFLMTSVGFGGLLLLPWWVLNVDDVLRFTLNITVTFDRHSLGEGISIEKFLSWIKLIRWTILGPAAALITLLFLGVFALHQTLFKKQQKVILWTLLLSIVPTLVLAFSGTNNNPRYVGPSLFLLAIVLGVIAQVTGWLMSWKKSFILVSLTMFQLTVMVWPTPGYIRYQKGDDSKTLIGANYTNIFRRPDQWNWGSFRNLVSARGIERPIVGELGMGSAFNPPQINYPWVAQSLRADVRLLWRYEWEDPIDWERVMKAAGECDVVVTAPGFIGKISNKNHLDNQYNTELVRRLEQDGRFEGPISLNISKFEPVELAIFFRKK